MCAQPRRTPASDGRLPASFGFRGPENYLGHTVKLRPFRSPRVSQSLFRFFCSSSEDANTAPPSLETHPHISEAPPIFRKNAPFHVAFSRSATVPGAAIGPPPHVLCVGARDPGSPRRCVSSDSRRCQRKGCRWYFWRLGARGRSRPSSFRATFDRGSTLVTHYRSRAVARPRRTAARTRQPPHPRSLGDLEPRRRTMLSGRCAASQCVGDGGFGAIIKKKE